MQSRALKHLLRYSRRRKPRNAARSLENVSLHFKALLSYIHFIAVLKSRLSEENLQVVVSAVQLLIGSTTTEALLTKLFFDVLKRMTLKICGAIGNKSFSMMKLNTQL